MSYSTYLKSNLAMGNQHVQYDPGKNDMRSVTYNPYNVWYKDLSDTSVILWQNPLAYNNIYDSAGTLPCLEPPYELHTPQAMSLRYSIYAPWQEIQPQQTSIWVKTEITEPCTAYPPSPLNSVTSPYQDSSARRLSTSNQSRLLSPSSHSSGSNDSDSDLEEYLQYDQLYDHDETKDKFVTDKSDVSPFERQGNWDTTLTRGPKKEVGPKGKVKRDEKRKMQNRLAQRAFRARTKAHHAQVNQQIAYLKALTESQATRLDKMTRLIERLQRENTILKTQRRTQTISAVQDQA